MNEATVARLQLFAAAALFSTGGAAIKAVHLGPFAVAASRSAIAFVALLILLPEARRLRDRRVWLVALAYAATMILFVSANKLTTSANATFLQSTAPLHIAILAPLLLREPTARRELGFMAALAVGLMLFFVGSQDPLDTAANPSLGNGIATLSGVTWALTLIGLRWLARDGGGGQAAAVAAGNLVAALVAAPLAFPTSLPTVTDTVILGYLGVFQIGLAYLFLIRGVRRVRAVEAGLLLLIESVLNPLWSWFLHAEVPDRWSLAGCSVILVSTIVHSTFGRDRAPRP